MQSKTDDLLAGLDAHDTERRPKSFELFEDYTQCDMFETIRIRRENYADADTETRRKLEAEVEGEVVCFCAWLEETKNFDPSTAHYLSVSLKSLLLGLPIGVQIAQLFDITLSERSETTH